MTFCAFLCRVGEGFWKSILGEGRREGGKIGAGSGGQAAGGDFDWSFQSDFTNEMGKCYGADRGGSKGHPCPCFLKSPSMAISPWAFDHFTSKMLIVRNSQNPPPAACPPLPAPIFPPSLRPSPKIDPHTSRYLLHPSIN